MVQECEGIDQELLGNSVYKWKMSLPMSKGNWAICGDAGELVKKILGAWESSLPISSSVFFQWKMNKRDICWKWERGLEILGTRGEKKSVKQTGRIEGWVDFGK